MPLFRTIAISAIGSKARHHSRGRGIVGSVAGLAAARIATRSVPGAIIIGGGLLAKTLYDRRKQKSDTAD